MPCPRPQPPPGPSSIPQNVQSALYACLMGCFLFEHSVHNLIDLLFSLPFFNVEAVRLGALRSDFVAWHCMDWGNLV